MEDELKINPCIGLDAFVNVPELVIETYIYNPIKTINMQDLQQYSFEKTKEENL